MERRGRKTKKKRKGKERKEKGKEDPVLEMFLASQKKVPYSKCFWLANDSVPAMFLASQKHFECGTVLSRKAPH